MNIQPAVTVSVLTYNSSKYVIETLESIKNQTYPNLILHICDDYSSDNTIELCRKWIELNNYRFISTNIIIPNQNTGVSANCNRAWDACETQYNKDIAGDDILLPNCIDDNMRYVDDHKNAVIVFSKVRGFCLQNGEKKYIDTWHDYSFFEKSISEKLKFLIEIGNRIPAAPAFSNIHKLRELKIRNDERIPLLEDYPKWINILRLGCDLDYFEKETVEYRINSESLSIGLFSPIFYRSNVLFYLYYYLDEIKEEQSMDRIYCLIAEKETNFYRHAYEEATSLKKQLQIIQSSKDYQLGKLLLFPFRYMKRQVDFVQKVYKLFT